MTKHDVEEIAEKCQGCFHYTISMNCDGYRGKGLRYCREYTNTPEGPW